MPKKNMTQDEKNAWGEKMRAAREAKQEAKEASQELEQPKVEHPVPQVEDTIIPETSTEALLRRIEELSQNQALLQAVLLNQNQGTQVRGNRMVGTTDKYIVDPDNYPDPRARLYKESRLAPYAFDINYELDWNISTVSYETKDGINMREPKFRLELWRVKLDDEGNKTDGRYVISKATFFEDPQAALIVAREKGLPIDEDNEKVFLDEMRYMRIRDWLLDNFYPPTITKTKSQKKDVVVGGKLVEYFEISSQDSESIPFDQLRGKVK